MRRILALAEQVAHVAGEADLPDEYDAEPAPLDVIDQGGVRPLARRTLRSV